MQSLCKRKLCPSAAAGGDGGGVAAAGGTTITVADATVAAVISAHYEIVQKS